MFIKQPKEFWGNVIFVDESKYNIYDSDGKQKVWRKPNTAMHVKNLRPTVKYGGDNQIVWGCMASSGVENLELFTGYGSSTTVLVCLRLLHKSPELNPIAHMWDYLLRKLYEDLRKHLVEEWAKIDG